jgi:hypothetical protein
MRPRTRALRRALIVLIVAGIAGTATGGVYAAFFASTSNSGSSFAAGTVILTDNDSGGAAVTLNAAQPGATDTGCIRLSYSGSLAATVRHYADVAGALAPYLTLKVTRGTDSSPSFRSCASFTPDALNYYGKGAGVLYSGLLSSYPTTYATGIVDPDAGSVSTYSSAIPGTTGLVGYWRLDPTFVSDTFTGTAGATLQSRNGEVGATWTKHSMSATDAVLSDVGRARKAGTGIAAYTASGTPSTANYSVSADVQYVSSLATDLAGVVGRMDTANANGTFYFMGYVRDAGAWYLIRLVNGTQTVLGTYNQALTAGNTYRATLDMQGTTIRGLVDGVQRITSTDAGISAAGRAGIFLGNVGSAAHTNTTGMHLDNFAAVSAVAADSVGTNHGTFNGGPTTVPGALPGDPDGATSFDGVNDYVSIARQVQDDLTLEFWFKSTQGLNTNAQWWGNAGLVDAEVNGGGNDFGVSLRSDGRITAGSGAVDTTVISSGSFNDGAWHHVAFTRERTTGVMKLYVDGALEGQATGTTIALNGPAQIHFGKIQGGTNYFAGEIDEVAVYNTPIPAATVAAHYAANAVTPEIWTNPENHSLKLEITLANTNAVEGLSATATFRWEARNQ